MTKKDMRGTGSKENVGRKKLPYEIVKLQKRVPKPINDLCLSLIDAEVLKFKLKLKKQK